MYRIIGGDGREYGPVDEDQLRQWIVEGRADGSTWVKMEEEEEWKSLGELEDFKELLGNSPDSRSNQAQAYAVPAFSPGLNLESCLKRSWNLFQNQAPILIGSSILFFILFYGVSEILGYFTDPAVFRMIEGKFLLADIGVIVISSLLSGTVSPLLYAGLYRVWLRCIHGEPVTLSDAFAGFSASAAPLAVSGLLITILTGLGFLVLIIPGIYLSVAWTFTTPLILERQMGVWQAMETSRQVVTGHWWVLFLLLIIFGVLSALGILLCCIGLILTFPLGFGALVFAYGDLFETTSAGRE